MAVALLWNLTNDPGSIQSIASLHQWKFLHFKFRNAETSNDAMMQ
jgi:hypothetical protein